VKDALAITVISVLREPEISVCVKEVDIEEREFD
jgi:hypothetical protein